MQMRYRMRSIKEHSELLASYADQGIANVEINRPFLEVSFQKEYIRTIKLKVYWRNHNNLVNHVETLCFTRDAQCASNA